MALPQKGRRTLIQESTTYHWLASSDDEGTWLTIEQAQQPELKVIVLVEHVNSTGGTNGGSNRQPAIVSPALVKRTILFCSFPMLMVFSSNECLFKSGREHIGASHTGASHCFNQVSLSHNKPRRLSAG
jgi:hypothetical protein